MSTVSATQPQPRSIAIPASAFRVVGIALALAALVVGVLGFMSASSAHSQLASVRAQMRAQSHQLASLQASTAAAASSRNVASLSADVSKLDVCVPELQQEVTGLSVSTQWTGIYGTDALTSAYLSNPTVISSTCQHTLNGNN